MLAFPLCREKLPPIFPRRFRSQRFPWKVQPGVYGLPWLSRPLSVAHLGLRSGQYCCFTITRCCSEGGFSVVSATARWRWAWRVTTRWRARPPSMLTLQKVSEPVLQWRKVQMDSGLALDGCPERSFFAVLGLPVKALDGSIPECDCVWVFAVAGRTKRFPPTSLPLQENVVWILRHQQRDGPTWSQSNTRELSTAVLEGVWHTSGRVCSPLVGGILARIDPFGGRAHHGCWPYRM